MDNNTVEMTCVMAILAAWCILLVAVNSCQKMNHAEERVKKQIKHTQEMERMRLDKCVWK